MDSEWNIEVAFERGSGVTEVHKRSFKGTINGVLRSLKEITKWGEVRKIIVEKGGEESDKKKRGTEEGED